MVLPLGPGKFYGSSLPRPRFYTDVKLNPDRVDPPFPVMDPLLSWAHEAHWSMGGLSFQRLRLQGRIEGNVDRLRKFREKQARLQPQRSPEGLERRKPDLGNEKDGKFKKRVGSVSPPLAPKVVKRRRFMDLFESESEDVEEEEEEEEEVVKKNPVRKLVGEFDKVAKEIEANKRNREVGEVVGVRTRRKALDEEVMKVAEEFNGKGFKGEKKRNLKKVGSEDGVRVSPRLAKSRSG